eukprot:6325441-Amphidinium_carterae.1
MVQTACSKVTGLGEAQDVTKIPSTSDIFAFKSHTLQLKLAALIVHSGVPVKADVIRISTRRDTAAAIAAPCAAFCLAAFSSCCSFSCRLLASTASTSSNSSKSKKTSPLCDQPELMLGVLEWAAILNGPRQLGPIFLAVS